jgi:hypothetical protein
LLFKGNYDYLPNVMPEGEGGPGLHVQSERERAGGLGSLKQQNRFQIWSL